VKLVTNLVQWLKRNRRVVADLDEPLVEAFRELSAGLLNSILPLW
jgi:hypothetical protein